MQRKEKMEAWDAEGIIVEVIQTPTAQATYIVNVQYKEDQSVWMYCTLSYEANKRCIRLKLLKI